MKLVLISIVTILLSDVAFADSSSGCGLGWQLFRKNSLLSSTFRNTTHAFLPNTFSMTFGTSGCAHHDIVKNEKRGIHFAENNFSELMIDIAKGEGEYLEGFAIATGYKGDMAIYGEMMQKNFSKIYFDENTDAITMYKNYKFLMTEQG